MEIIGMDFPFADEKKELLYLINKAFQEIGRNNVKANCNQSGDKGYGKHILEINQDKNKVIIALVSGKTKHKTNMDNNLILGDIYINDEYLTNIILKDIGWYIANDEVCQIFRKGINLPFDYQHFAKVDNIQSEPLTKDIFIYLFKEKTI